jgi:hypothetical protein
MKLRNLYMKSNGEEEKQVRQSKFMAKLLENKSRNKEYITIQHSL